VTTAIWYTRAGPSWGRIPQRDLDRIEQVLDRLGVRRELVAETRFPRTGWAASPQPAQQPTGGSRHDRRRSWGNDLDKNRFVERLVAGLTDFPAYYAHMGAPNRSGPAPVDLSRPEPVDFGRLRERIVAGKEVVDQRDRTAYTADHVAGTDRDRAGRTIRDVAWLAHPVG
jgi:hypothetical protein